MSTPARLTALRVLESCRTHGAWADAALKAQLSRDGLTRPDAALCSRIVYGVLQNQMLLDFYLAAYCSMKPDHLQPPLLNILRMGAYQILYLDQDPGQRRSQRVCGAGQDYETGASVWPCQRCSP